MDPPKKKLGNATGRNTMSDVGCFQSVCDENCCMGVCRVIITNILAEMSKRSGGGIATVTMGLCKAYWSKLIEDINTNQSEVKASKSDQLLRSYNHLKFCMIFHRA